MDYSYFGWLGMACIVMCWVPQTYETIKHGVCGINRGFLILTVVGTVSLTIHAAVLNDLPFVILNGAGFFGSTVNLYVSYFPRNTSTSISSPQ